LNLWRFRDNVSADDGDHLGCSPAMKRSRKTSKVAG